MRYALPIVLFAGLLWFFVRGLSLDPGSVPSPLIGQPAPNFSLPDLKDPEETFTHTQLLGKPTLLNVWATWCVGCRQEHEFLLQLAGSGLIPIYGLNWKDDSPAAIQWLKELGDPYVQIGADISGKVAIDWGVYGAPETFLIAADGTVLYKHLSPLTPEIWEREFAPRIAGPKNQP